MAITRKTRLSEQQVRNLVNSLPSIIDGTQKDRFGIRSTFMGTVAHHLFSKIHEAYMDKSRGQSDELGNRWKPLKESTKIARLSKPHVKRKLGLQNRKRGLLTSSQDKSWRQLYAQVLSNLMNQGVDYFTARDIAAGTAWNALKAAGALTRASLAKQVFTPIMIDTGRLVGSLAPSKGSGSYYRPSKDQVYETPPGELVLGTKVEYAEKASEERPIWPDNIDPWVDEAVDKGLDAIMEKIAGLVS